jgi:hypothetical protein
MKKSFARATRAVADDAEQRAAGAGQNAAGSSQSGTAPALVNGASPAPIPADVTAGSLFFFTLKTAIGQPGFPSATNKVPGQPGSFAITSSSGTDNSVYDYLILEP